MLRIYYQRDVTKLTSATGSLSHTYDIHNCSQVDTEMVPLCPDEIKVTAVASVANSLLAPGNLNKSLDVEIQVPVKNVRIVCDTVGKKSFKS